MNLLFRVLVKGNGQTVEVNYSGKRSPSQENKKRQPPAGKAEKLPFFLNCR
jgi:hypothetical protein